MNHIKNFEDLREHIWQGRQGVLELLCERLEELDEFNRGLYKGEVLVYDEMLELLRRIVKYGDE